MKLITRQKLKTLIFIRISIFIALFLFGCDQQTNPIITANDNVLETNTASTNAQDIQFLDLFPETQGLQKDGTLKCVSATISRRYGGQLKYVFDGSRAKLEKWRNTNAWVTLDIPPHAVDSRVEISLVASRQLLFGGVDMEYSPHGLVFNKPAILNIRAENIDLSDVDPEGLDNLQLYYVNQETGKWEPMVCERIRLDVEKKLLVIKNGQLPHFSRYAMAYGR